MKIKCEFCNNYITELDENCPHCGAINPQYKRQSDQTPRTIEELQAWYAAMNLPPKEVTRFFIGENYTGARAFGIYRDGERFIVYKNKDDGSRAIRYDGSDEAYAVNELYLKLKERIAEQKARNAGTQQQTKEQLKGAYILAGVLTAVFVGIFGILFFSASKKIDAVPNRGYYEYGGEQYYYLNGWYEYSDDSDDWVPTEVDSDFKDNAKDYYRSGSYDSAYEVSDFEDTEYYADWKDNQSWDSDSSWSGSDSWDSGGGDWSSDW